MYSNDIYGKFKPILNLVLNDLIQQIEEFNIKSLDNTNERAYEHLISRIKTPESMIEKCQRKNLPVTTILPYMTFMMLLVFVLSVDSSMIFIPI